SPWRCQPPVGWVSFTRRLRHLQISTTFATRPLDQYIIESIEEAQDQATQWLWTYNNDRPNMGIGGITPAMKLKMAA
ncbi:transposase InsO family protein, partial [Roseovarius sp. MBR-79]